MFRTNTFPDGTVATEERRDDATIVVRRPDGMVYETRKEADPRFSMLAAFTGESVARTPAGLERTSTQSREVTLANRLDRLSLTTEANAATVNGKTWSTSYLAGPPRRSTSTSPEGRVSTALLDDHGRVTRSQMADLAPVTFAYREDGLLERTQQGDGADARVASMT